MEIQLDDKTMLGADTLNWIIYKKVANKKAEEGWVWMANKFYRTPGDAIKAQANREIRECDANSFLDAVKEVERIAKKYNAILTLFEEDKNKS